MWVEFVREGDGSYSQQLGLEFTWLSWPACRGRTTVRIRISIRDHTRLPWGRICFGSRTSSRTAARTNLLDASVDPKPAIPFMPCIAPIPPCKPALSWALRIISKSVVRSWAHNNDSKNKNKGVRRGRLVIYTFTRVSERRGGEGGVGEEQGERGWLGWRLRVLMLENATYSSRTCPF